MARKIGDKMFIKIPLSTLVRVLAETPDVKIAVSKGNLAELESVLEVNFGLSEDGGEGDGAVAQSTAAKDESAENALGSMEVE